MSYNIIYKECNWNYKTITIDRKGRPIPQIRKLINFCLLYPSRPYQQSRPIQFVTSAHLSAQCKLHTLLRFLRSNESIFIYCLGMYVYRINIPQVAIGNNTNITNSILF